MYEKALDQIKSCDVGKDTYIKQLMNEKKKKDIALKMQENLNEKLMFIREKYQNTNDELVRLFEVKEQSLIQIKKENDELKKIIASKTAMIEYLNDEKISAHFFDADDNNNGFSNSSPERRVQPSRRCKK